MLKDIKKIIKEWKDEAELNHNDIVLISAYPTIRETLKICTNKPGWMIGKGGCLYEKYKEKIMEQFESIKNIEFVETDSWYIR